MTRRAGLTGLLIVLIGCAASPVRLLEAPSARLPDRAVILTAEVRLWGRFGRQSLPLPEASRIASAHARAALGARLPAPPCAAPEPTAHPDLEHALALYQRVATAWLANPETARAGLSLGTGLNRFGGGCGTALILLGQQLPSSGGGPNWLSLGAIDLSDGRLLKLATTPLDPEEDLSRPEVLAQQVARLVGRVYR